METIIIKHLPRIHKRKPHMHRIMMITIVAFSLMLHAYSSPPDSTSRGIVKGSGYEFEISAPKGWVLDLTSGAPDGMDAQIYPQGSSFASSASVMFISALSKKMPGCESVAKLATADVNRAKKQFPNVVITRSDSLMTKGHKKAYVRNYASANFQAVAYVDEDSTIVMFVLRSKDKIRFDNARYSLKDLVGSYKWLMKKPE
jgi:hypothetical protein